MGKIGQAVRDICAEEGGGAELEAITPLLIDNLRTVDQQIAHRTFTMLAFLVGFELLLRSALAEVSLPGFKVTDLSYVEKAAPLAIAYVFYSIWNLMSARRMLEVLYDLIMTERHPKLADHDIILFLRPPQPFKTLHLVNLVLKSRTGRWLDASGIPGMVVLFLVPPGLILLGLARLQAKYDGFDWLLGVPGVVALFFILQAFVLAVAPDGS